jgi:transcriptional regulator with XRE-family HTH domain
MKNFKELFEEARKRDRYWVASAILDFTEEVYRLMEERKLSKTDVAKSMKVSPAYVTKIFKGTENFTIDTMVRLTKAVSGKLHLHVAPEDIEVKWVENFAANLTPIISKIEIHVQPPQEIVMDWNYSVPLLGWDQRVHVLNVVRGTAYEIPPFKLQKKEAPFELQKREDKINYDFATA